MKQGQGSKRTRGRSGGRRGSNRQQLFDSNGPSVRIRGNAFQVHEKYLGLARDAAGSGDRVAAENFYQHAEHYFRIYSADQEERAQRQAANGQHADSQRRNSGNGSGNRSQNAKAENGDGRAEVNGANGANGEDRKKDALAPESTIDLTEKAEATAEAPVAEAPVAEAAAADAAASPEPREDKEGLKRTTRRAPRRRRPASGD
ncbi:MAG: DUF4167 domain-containing protein [Pseudomonadota bacterium]